MGEHYKFNVTLNMNTRDQLYLAFKATRIHSTYMSLQDVVEVMYEVFHHDEINIILMGLDTEGLINHAELTAVEAY